MRGLDGARVVLVDDDPTEATPVISAFAKVGVPIAYFDASAGCFPSSARKLRGVRLAILDVDLGFGGSKENIASTLVQTVSRIIRPDNGPYGILIWTNNPDQKDLVTEYIFKRSDLPRPVFVEMLKKANFLQKANSPNGTRHFKMSKLSSTLGTLLADKSPLECLQVWEGLTFAAATDVTNGLTGPPDSSATDLAEWVRAWQEETLRLLFAASKAQAEKLHSEANCVPALFLALNPLVADRMEGLVDRLTYDWSLHAARIMKAGGGSKTERKAKVNSMLHLAADDLKRVSAGNLYVFGKRSRPTLVPTLRQLVLDVVDGDAGKKKKNTQALLDRGYLCGVEISPLCDHAQQNIRISRLILGLLVPEADVSTIKPRAAFLKRCGPFYFAKSRRVAEGPYSLFLNARYMTAATPAAVCLLRATVRLRPQLLADVQSWTGYQGSRQGVMLLG